MGVLSTSFTAYETNGATARQQPHLWQWQRPPCRCHETSACCSRPGGGPAGGHPVRDRQLGHGIEIGENDCTADELRHTLRVLLCGCCDGTTDIYTPHGWQLLASPPCAGMAGAPPGGLPAGSTTRTPRWVTSAGGTGRPDQPGNAGNEKDASSPCLVREIVVPIYNAYSASGSNATYTIAGYATFTLYRLLVQRRRLRQRYPTWRRSARRQWQHILHPGRLRSILRRKPVRLARAPDFGTFLVYLSS